MGATTYNVLSPLKHDGQDYAAGDLVVLDAKTAGPLLAAGTIAEPESRSGETGESPEVTGAAALQADTAPESSTEAVADPNATTDRGESPTTDRGESPTTEGAAGAPAAPRAGAPVVPITSKSGKKVGK